MLATKEKRPLDVRVILFVPAMILMLAFMWVVGGSMMAVTHEPSHCAVGNTIKVRQYLPDSIITGELHYISNWSTPFYWDSKLLAFRKDFDLFCRQAFGPDAEAYNQFAGVH